MKSIILTPRQKPDPCLKEIKEKIKEPKKTREVIKFIQEKEEKKEKEEEQGEQGEQEISALFSNHALQLDSINAIGKGKDVAYNSFILRELRYKIHSYKQQDIKKDLHDIDLLVTLDDVINKLVDCKLICYYCNLPVFVVFEKVREATQWTLDRLNNLDEHTCANTIISCLKCNLQRRRKNSDKFRFTKHLETNQLTIKKLI